MSLPGDLEVLIALDGITVETKKSTRVYTVMQGDVSGGKWLHINVIMKDGGRGSSVIVPFSEFDALVKRHGPFDIPINVVTTPDRDAQ